MIDWLTLRIGLADLSPATRLVLSNLGDRIQRFDPATGEVRYTTQAWASVRSDSGQIACRVGSDFWIQGSPARCVGDFDTVFSSGSSAAHDVSGCALAMIAHVSAALSVDLPVDLRLWLCSRVDVTRNLLFSDLVSVRSALSYLRGVSGGRYRVSSVAGDSVYWGGASRLRKAKAYAKGPHLAYLLSCPSYSGRAYSGCDLSFADRLLRLELTLGREWFRRRDAWYTLGSSVFLVEWDSYFSRMLSGVDMPASDDSLMSRLLSVASSVGRARAAYCTFSLIRSMGWERAYSTVPRSSWYRHIALLRLAGLSDGALSSGSLTVLRVPVLAAQVCESWPVAA